MKKLFAVLLTALAPVFALNVHAQGSGKQVQLKDLGVQPQQSNPNVISGPMDPKPAPAQTFQQKLDQQYQQSQSQTSPTIITKPQTHPNESSAGVGVSIPINGSGVTPSGSSGKASKQ